MPREIDGGIGITCSAITLMAAMTILCGSDFWLATGVGRLWCRFRDGASGSLHYRYRYSLRRRDWNRRSGSSWPMGNPAE